MHTFACISASTHTHLNMLFWLCVSMNICISYRTFWVNLEFVTFSLFTRGWQENSDQHFHKALCRCFYFAKLKLTAFFIHQTPPITHVCILCFPNPNFLSSACQMGFYKAVSGSISCTECPANSRTSLEASKVCECRSGFYRAPSDANTTACTGKDHMTTVAWLYRF